ncbi:histidine triad nucleotide-binding protein [Fusibacter bizertensis]|uniref:Histidine triad nucleotide-binding protein n=1 Tax=Fusibacter bizertensis TaxID=1488331 RepID=A0ABT6NDA6_9FIRM|nr:histidine triad nucleotide-binding protein [Fusibacter bizertensis]MDH8678404.1 histidine triad nucleotide-binding protein [Fusibacter bizertensis]
MDCIFCKIISGDIPSTKVYEDEHVYAFKDINPEAPVHVLIVPKEHIESVAHLDATHHSLIGHIHLIAKQIAEDAGIDQSGYRLLTNIGKDGGQSVLHLHYHLLGGRLLKWPPG